MTAIQPPLRAHTHPTTRACARTSNGEPQTHPTTRIPTATDTDSESDTDTPTLANTDTHPRACAHPTDA
eukprot:3297419-Alexandrium_andersonii.AAC.1